MYGFPVEANLTAIGRDKSRQNFHQRTFARAVFAEQAVNGPGLDGERNAIVRAHETEMFVDI